MCGHASQATGNEVPEPISTFTDVDLGTALMANVQRCKYTKPTPVQRYSMPIGLAGRDLMACAQTGSGKTAAFCFPIIANILRSGQPPASRSRKVRLFTSFPALDSISLQLDSLHVQLEVSCMLAAAHVMSSSLSDEA